MTHASEPMGNWSELIRRAGQRHAARIAMIDSGRSITWGELDAAADAGAADLLESGTHRGDRALVALPSSADLVLALVAAARAGLVAVPVDPHRADLATVAARVGTRLLLVAEGSPEIAGVPTMFGAADLRRWWTARRAPVAAVGGGEDLAVLARASRSYRAVMISHRAVRAAVAAATGAPGSRLRADDRAVMALPVHHLAGLVTAFLPLAEVGATAVFPEVDPAGGDLSALPTLIRSARVTIIPGSPGVYRALLAADGVERALASVHLMTSGAAPLPPSDFSAIRAVTGQHVWEGYGISESTSVVASSLMTSRSRAGSVGRALGGIEIRIDSGDDDQDTLDPAVVWEDQAPEAHPADPAEVVAAPALPAAVDVATSGPATGGTTLDAGTDGPAVDTSAAEAAAAPVAGAAPGTAAGRSGVRALDANLADVAGMGDVGRISLRGATLFSGYWPDGSDGPGDDGWYCTEDVGYLDDLGELHLVDRADETFTVSGFTVYPKEIEQVLGARPDVGAVVVGAVPGAGSKPARVVAVISARAGADRPTVEELQQYVTDRLPVFKRPTEFAFVEAIPLTELGRQDRAAALGLAGFARAGRSVAVVSTPRPTAVRSAQQDTPADAPFTADPVASDTSTASTDPEPGDVAQVVDDAAATEPFEPVAADRGPEQAADLDSLGGRLPGAGNRRARSLSDDDDDLFGSEYS